jgi:hypothetical protein
MKNIIKIIIKGTADIIFLPRNLALHLLVFATTTQIAFCSDGSDPFAPTTSYVRKLFGPDSALMTDANYLIGVGGIAMAVLSPMNVKQAAAVTIGVYALKYVISYGIIGAN